MTHPSVTFSCIQGEAEETEQDEEEEEEEEEQEIEDEPEQEDGEAANATSAVSKSLKRGARGVLSLNQGKKSAQRPRDQISRPEGDPLPSRESDDAVMIECTRCTILKFVCDFRGRSCTCKPCSSEGLNKANNPMDAFLELVVEFGLVVFEDCKTCSYPVNVSARKGVPE